MRITKTLANHFAALAKSNGYWSAQVREFLADYDYVQAKSLHSKASEILGSDITKF